MYGVPVLSVLSRNENYDRCHKKPYEINSNNGTKREGKLCPKKMSLCYHMTGFL